MGEATSNDGCSVIVSRRIAIMSITQPASGIADEEKEVGPLSPRSDRVIEFCQSHAIESYLTKAEELATHSSLKLSG